MEEHKELRKGVQTVCKDYPGNYWQALDKEEKYPQEFVQALTNSGYLATLIPEKYGGSGLNLRAASVILEEIQANGCNGSACHAQMYTMGVLLRHGSEAQKEKYLADIASGKLRLQAFAVTEPNVGSDTTRIQTRAEKVGNTYRINGQKIWTSRSMYSDLMVLLARTTPLDKVSKKTHGLSAFLVDLKKATQSGLTIRPIQTMMNHSTTEIFFDNLEIPSENLIGEEGKGFYYILDGMNAERLLIASECIGDAKWFIQKSCEYANKRVVFDRPIGQNQGIQFPLARVYASMCAAELMVQKGCEIFDSGLSCAKEANMSLLLSSEASWEAANAAIQTHGGFGFAAEYDIERKFRETRLYQVAPLSKNLILSYIAEHVLGLPRSY
ncbi:MAG: acyl-CoA/acyl-ACP dehydrogenase [Leptospiraceae bacterium]|nr:acyl-CoA/acyl-ACP dehydrogenase [Leptospiraceae bacterium]MCP5495881.1 acyl-CoA/acyl-ACP dehydrogenase [Leptospiraceae bacterium]